MGGFTRGKFSYAEKYKAISVDEVMDNNRDICSDANVTKLACILTQEAIFGNQVSHCCQKIADCTPQTQTGDAANLCTYMLTSLNKKQYA